MTLWSWDMQTVVEKLVQLSLQTFSDAHIGDLLTHPKPCIAELMHTLFPTFANPSIFPHNEFVSIKGHRHEVKWGGGSQL